MKIAGVPRQTRNELELELELEYEEDSRPRKMTGRLHRVPIATDKALRFLSMVRH